MDIKRGTQFLFIIQSILLLYTVKGVCAVEGQTSGLAVFLVLCAAYFAWSLRMARYIERSTVEVTQGGTSKMSIVTIVAVCGLSLVAMVILAGGGLAFLGSAWAFGFLLTIGTFALISVRPAVVIDRDQRTITRYYVGVQFPLPRRQTRTTDFASIGVDVLRTIVRGGDSYDQWQITLDRADGNGSLVIEKVAVGDVQRWDYWCELLQLPKREEKLAAASVSAAASDPTRWAPNT